MNAVETVLSIVIMISTGYILTAKKWFDESTSKLFTRLVCNISLPCLMLSNLMGNFDREKLSHMAKGLVIPFSSMVFCYMIGAIVSKIIKVKEGRVGTFRSMFFVSNSIFIGLPINLALFGEKSIPYVLLYYIANSTLFWTVGVYGICMDGQVDSKNCKAKILSIDTLKRIASPPLMGFLFGILLILLGVKLPKTILDTCKYFGSLTTPLSMLFIGITIYNVDLKKVKISIDMIAVILGRFLVSPLIVLLIVHFYPVPALMKNVFIVQAAMPVMTNTAIVAKSYNADHEYGTIMAVVTTVLSVVSIPLYMAIL